MAPWSRLPLQQGLLAALVGLPQLPLARPLSGWPRAEVGFFGTQPRGSEREKPRWDVLPLRPMEGEPQCSNPEPCQTPGCLIALPTLQGTG